MRHILIVDDETEISNLLRSFIHEIVGDDVDIVCCGDGAMAFDEVKRHQFDLVITDLMMPRINGLELIELIKCDMGHTELPVICCSAFLPKIDANVNASLLENVFFLEKPIEFDKFSRVFKIASLIHEEVA